MKRKRLNPIRGPVNARAGIDPVPMVCFPVNWLRGYGIDGVAALLGRACLGRSIVKRRRACIAGKAHGPNFLAVGERQGGSQWLICAVVPYGLQGDAKGVVQCLNGVVL